MAIYVAITSTRLTVQNVDGIEEFSDGSKQEQLKNGEKKEAIDIALIAAPPW